MNAALKGRSFLKLLDFSAEEIRALLDLAADFKAKKNKLDKGRKPYRINRFSWWSRELPSREELRIGRDKITGLSSWIKLGRVTD